MSETRTHNVREHLRLGNEAYDSAIRRFIPGYDAMLNAAADAVAAIDPSLVQDLGAGTGALSEVLLARRGVGTVELLDVDPEMLKQAQQRLKRFGNRTRFTLRSYDEPFSSCDAFAASLSLHHVATIEIKSALFARVFGALRHGGVFVNADVNMPTEHLGKNRLYQYWAEHMVKNGIAEDHAWQYFEEWSAEDAYFPLADEEAKLQNIGFETTCVFKNGPVNVVVAKKT
ncbi:MAG: class I SAM-dependent methyltransferase [Rhodothermia bacterium]|nr:MAG: class I SAM-dependent methyltransferase [Rhodothermia bacterium]